MLLSLNYVHIHYSNSYQILLENSKHQLLIDHLLSEIKLDQQLLSSLAGKKILIKIGGNALTDDLVKEHIIEQIAVLKFLGATPILVHGGGIDIENLLAKLGVTSDFVGGHRMTDQTLMTYIEMVLSGSLNKEFVRIFNSYDIRSVGLSGKDAGMVKTVKRFHTIRNNNIEESTDIGFVGDVSDVDTSLLSLLMSHGYLPVISPVSIGEDGKTYNVNADMFAGHLAAALKVDSFIALSNINGLLKDLDDPESVMHSLTGHDVEQLVGSVIQGGMIPKIDSCLIAIEQGVSTAHIANGTNRSELLRILLTNDLLGTTITQ